MSGGSFDYMFYKVEEAYCGHMEDEELDGMMCDLCKLLKELEWYVSSDTSEEQYRAEIKSFKAKWFDTPQDTRIKQNIIKHLNDAIEIIKREE